MFILPLSLQTLAVKLKPGHWHTEFQLRSGIILPVDFFYIAGKQPSLTIKNGEEFILLDQIRMSNDSLYILFPAFDSELKLKVLSKTSITGAWYNRAKSPTYNIHLTSVLKKENNHRYPTNGDTKKFLGKWETTFSYLSNPEKAIGLFNAPNDDKVPTNGVYGTFLTETGDYRFLEGAVVNDSLYLSCFDGSHAFLFRAIFRNDTLWGDFHSGNHFRTEWYAVRNNSFELRDPDSITYVVNENPVKFDLMNLDGSTYSFPNKYTQDKVVLIQIMGTWCPNCLDESNYLKTVYEKHEDDLEIIAVAFENAVGNQDKVDRIRTYTQNLGLTYPFLIGGDACKSCAAKIFPQLNEVVSFPTLIFIDKKGNIRKIHTGFSGPGTGEIYSAFVKETDAFIESLINE